MRAWTWMCLLRVTIGTERGSRMIFSPEYPRDYSEALAVYALTGLANRDEPLVWLNASSKAPGSEVEVNWPYPEADSHWMQYLKTSKSIDFDVLPNGSFCTLLQEVRAVKPEVVKGLVMYELDPSINSLQFLALTAAGLLNAVPAHTALRASASCLQSLPILLVLPAAASFTDDLEAYDWGVQNFLSNTSTRMQVGACRNWANYTCGWGDPLGSAAIDVGVAERAFVHNLSPNSGKNPRQAAMFAKILSHLEVGSVFTGWAEPESDMIGILSEQGVLQLCGAPNLAFLRKLASKASRLPYHRGATRQLNRSRHYVVFQSNEGDTPKNAYSFRGGNWLSKTRGVVRIAWGVDPLIADYFPGLWQYYVDSASTSDQFFGATGGLGYTYPWSLPNKDDFFKRAGDNWAEYMPQPNNWVDVWEGGINTSLYERFQRIANYTVAGFSQQTIGKAVNTWLVDGTPLFLPDEKLWYPEEKGFCNRTDDIRHFTDCIEKLVNEVLSDKEAPFFVLIYGQSFYVDVAFELQRRHAGPEGQLEIIGAQDLADLGKQAAPGRLDIAASGLRDMNLALVV